MPEMDGLQAVAALRAKESEGGYSPRIDRIMIAIGMSGTILFCALMTLCILYCTVRLLDF